MAPKKSKKSKKTKTKKSIKASSTSSPSTFSFEVVNITLPQTLPGGQYPTNPYQYDGPRAAFEAKTVEEGFYVKVDMPGVGKETLEVKFENKKLSFKGEAPTKYPFEFGPRKYSGEIIFSLESLEVSEFKAKIKNGVLRVVLSGSGFPPNYIAVSSHATRRVPELPKALSRVDDEWMVIFQQFLMLDPPANFVGNYPFQLDGPRGPSEMLCLNEEYCFHRIDMPDVDEEGLILKMSDHKLAYGGDGKEGSKYDYMKRRQYVGQFQLQCPCCDLVDMEGEIVDGVVRLLLKKVKDEPTGRIGHATDPKDDGPC